MDNPNITAVVLKERDQELRDVVTVYTSSSLMTKLGSDACQKELGYSLPKDIIQDIPENIRHLVPKELINSEGDEHTADLHNPASPKKLTLTIK